jgi:hypothetical protein
MDWRLGGGLAALCGACLAVSALPASAATGPATVRITNVQTSLSFVDQGPPGHGAGDLEIIRQSLFNRRVSRRAIGRASVVCTMLGGMNRSCSATYVLPKGSLMTSGMIGSRLLYELAVVGGTGLYDNARGSLVVTTTALNPRQQVLVFRLAG